MSEPIPITCEEALRQLAAFLDDELHGGARGSVERHLEACRSCLSRAEFERRLKSELGRVGQDEVTPDFEARVRRLLETFTT
jgi:anti-sigma factor (TIGR02949 family)